MAYTKNNWVNGDVITANKLNHMENGIEAADAGGGLTADIRDALLQLASKVAYIDANGQDYYDDLYDAFYAVQSIYLNTNSILINTIGGTSQLTATTSPSGASVSWSSSDSSVATVSSSGLVTSVALGSCTITATAGSKTVTCSVTVAQKTLSSISAVYTQSGTVYTNTSLDSLKTDLVVTAHWSDNTTSTVSSSDYTLSGTLTAGTSTVTVSYGGKTTTFNVTVTAAPTLSSISAVYTQSGSVYVTTSLDDLKTDLVVTAHYSDSSSSTVASTDYTLSGTLTVGTSTITVSYGGKTTTFNVTVSSNPLPAGYTQYDYISRTSGGGGGGVVADISMSTDYTLETEIVYNNTTQASAIPVLGTRNGASGDKEFAVFVTPTSGKLGYWVNGTDTTQTINPFTNNVRAKVTYLPVGKSQSYPLYNVFKVDNTEYSTGDSSTGVTFHQWLGLLNYAKASGALNANGVNAIGLCVGETIIKNANDVIIHDLVPVSDGTNKGYYDTITGTLYTGTGITAGNWT